MAVSRSQHRLSLAILSLLVLLTLPCRPCAARNDPGGGPPVGRHRPTCKLCLFVVLPAAAAAAAAAAVVLIALIFCKCHLRNRDATVALAGDQEKVQDVSKVTKSISSAPSNPWPIAPRWSRDSRPPPDNPMSINPTMVRSPEVTPNRARYTMSPPTASSSPAPSDVTGLHRSQSRAQYSPLRPAGQRAQSTIEQKKPVKMKDPLACYSPTVWEKLTDIRYDKVEEATKGFKSESQLGRRGEPWQVLFEDVKFVLNNGLTTRVVIKRYDRNFSDKECSHVRKELNSMSTLRHKNLVTLHGFSLGKGRLYLVYDCMTNGSLEKLLFPDAGGPGMDWPLRYSIVKDVAQGLDQLHVSSTPHRSISTSNIMLDYAYTAYIDDHFVYRPGVSSGSGGGTSAATDDSLDLGAVILEIVCGRRRAGNATTPPLLNWVRQLHDSETNGGEERLIHAVDPRLQGEIDKEQATKQLQIGLPCSHPDPKQRLSVSGVRKILLDVKQMPQLPPSKPT